MNENMARPGTTSRIVLDYFYSVGESTLQEAYAALAGLVTRRATAKSIENQVEYGKLVRDGDKIRMTRAMRAAYDAIDDAPEVINKPRGEVVSAPYRNVFGPELSAKHYLPKQSMRPGADDFRAWPSRMN